MSWKRSSRKQKRDMINREYKRRKENKIHKIHLKDGKLSINGGEITPTKYLLDKAGWRSNYAIKQPFKVVMSGTQVDTNAYAHEIKEMQKHAGKKIAEKLGLHENQVIFDDPVAKDIDWKEFRKEFLIPTYYDDRSLITRKISQGTGISQRRLLGIQKGVIIGSEVKDRNKIQAPLPEIKDADFHDGAWTIRNVTIQKRTDIESVGMWKEITFSENPFDDNTTTEGYSVGYSGNGWIT